MAHEQGKRIPDRKRSKLTGRGKGYSFLRLPHFVLESVEFSELSGSAVKLLLDVSMLFKGSNNGNLAIVWSSLKLRGWRSKATIQKARNELLGTGWLLCTRHGGRNRCSLYAITWEPVDECPDKGLEVPAEKVASHLWRKRNHCPNNWETGAPETGAITPIPEQDCPRKWVSDARKAA
ncbi:hypothetical protein [Luteibacter sp.]|uniref:hypothetical protein n=1 Tax=Luteibacter sp. TaxID=1886636 RepID=UPI0028073AAC|nr:hypothetical protein [Luteibacter sp.]MDQ8050855.1 hypothetical protein [Luteibacter sp.]